MTDRDDEFRQAELILDGMERDGLKACERPPLPEPPKSWDRNVRLTDEQKAETLFARLCRAAWRAGRGCLIPWMWERYRDGQAQAEAYMAMMQALAKKERDRQASREAADSREVPSQLGYEEDPRD